MIDGMLKNRYLISSTTNDAGYWCRVYSDGWCEQGGVFTCNVTYGTRTELIKAYRDTNYTILLSSRDTSGSDTVGWPFSNDKTTTGFKLWAAYGNGALSAAVATKKIEWFTCGYV